MSAEKGGKPQQIRPGCRQRFVAAVALVFLAVLVLLAPPFWRAHQKAVQADCYCNVEQIALGMAMFADQHDGRLPNAQTWVEELEPIIRTRAVFKCPGDWSRQQVSYAMVRRWSGAKLDDIPNRAETVLIYEVIYGQPAYRHLGGMNVAYADGHVNWIEQLPPGTLDE